MRDTNQPQIHAAGEAVELVPEPGAHGKPITLVEKEKVSVLGFDNGCSPSPQVPRLHHETDLDVRRLPGSSVASRAA